MEFFGKLLRVCGVERRAPILSGQAAPAGVRLGGCANEGREPAGGEAVEGAEPQNFPF
jgi:hypothetical protein